MGGKTKTATTTTSSRADIPAFLQPFLSQAAQTSGRALGDYESMVGDIVNSMPASAGDLNAQATQSILDYVGGNDPNRELATQKLAGIAGGRALRDISYGMMNMEGDPRLQAQQSFNQQPVNANVNDTFNSLMNPNFIGSEGFNANVDASIRAAQPYIYSGFGKSGGVGATKGGLAQVAMQQAASDAFARLYGDERNRQLGAAQGMSNAEAQKAQAAAMAANAAAARERNRITERGMAADLLARERQNQMIAASGISGIGLENANALFGAAGVPLSATGGLLSGAASAIPANVIGQTSTQQTPYRTGGLGSILGGGLALASMVPGASAGLGVLGGLLGGRQSNMPPPGY